MLTKRSIYAVLSALAVSYILAPGIVNEGTRRLAIDDITGRTLQEQTSHTTPLSLDCSPGHRAFLLDWKNMHFEPNVAHQVISMNNGMNITFDVMDYGSGRAEEWAVVDNYLKMTCSAEITDRAVISYDGRTDPDFPADFTSIKFTLDDEVEGAMIGVSDIDSDFDSSNVCRLRMYDAEGKEVNTVLATTGSVVSKQNFAWEGNMMADYPEAPGFGAAVYAKSVGPVKSVVLDLSVYAYKSTKVGQRLARSLFPAIDFYYSLHMGRIEGRVTEDINDDEIGDRILENVPITLYDSKSQIVSTTLTDNLGEYLFWGLPLGSYTVKETNLDGYEDVADADGVNDNEILIHLAASSANSVENNFVDRKPLPKVVEPTGSIGGRVTEDTNNDDVADKALNGVLVSLLKGRVGKEVIATTLTQGRGTYLFSNVPLGVYTVQETNLPNYVDVSDVYKDNDNMIPVWVTPSHLDHISKNFLNRLVGSISGRCTVDTDGDNSGDKPLAGVEVALIDQKDNVIETITDGKGNFVFEQVPIGTYSCVRSPLADHITVNHDMVSAKIIPGQLSIKNIEFISKIGQQNKNPKGSISGRVTEDENNDGVPDKALNDVLITLYEGKHTEIVIATTLTHGRGMYTFTELPVGVYTVVETNLPDYVDVSDVYHDNDGMIHVWITPEKLDHMGKNFVNKIVGTITGHVTEDIDNDGIGDKPLINVRVALVDENDDVVEVSTDGDGKYIFSLVPMGSYTVLQENLPDYEDVAEPDGVTDSKIDVTLTPGKFQSIGLNFVDKKKKNGRTIETGSVSGRITEDVDNDGKADKALNGVLVTLLEGREGDTVVATTLSANRGMYMFSDLPVGVYTVTEENLPNYIDISDIYHENDNKIPVWITPTKMNHFGKNFINALVGSVSGSVTEDTDGDTVGDKPLIDVMVALVDGSRHVATTMTSEDGTFIFARVPIGHYSVTEENPSLHVDVADSDGENDNKVHVKIARESLVVEGVYFVDKYEETPPEELKGSVTGRCTEDTDGDGSPDRALNNVLITLLEGKDGSRVIATTLTANAGLYTFSDLSLGVYTVMETNLPDYIDISDIYKDNDNKIPVWITATDLHQAGKNFINGRVGTISGHVTEDIDGDNIGDKPLLHILVALLDGEDHVAETTTNSNGEFNFTRVPMGSYTVVQENLPDYVDVGDADGVNDNKVVLKITADHMDATGTDFVDMKTVPVAPPTKSFGSISGRVTEDIDNDGKADKALDGVLVTLLEGKEGSRVVATTLTHNRGTYSFVDLPVGVYTVTEQNLPDYIDVSDVYHENDNLIPVWITADRLHHEGKNFLNRLVGSISGRVTEDIDNDGAGDKPLVNIMVALLDKGDHVAETVTNDNGEFEFPKVPMGQYEITQQNLPEYVDVTDSDGVNDNKVTITLMPSALVSIGNDFVDKLDKAAPPPNEIVGSIGGRVTEDINNDDVPDKALDGVLITLYKGRDGDRVVATTLTHNKGTYIFSNLPAGVYLVVETNLPDYVDVSDVYHANDNKIPVWITPTNPDHSGKNFVNRRVGRIRGQVTEDTNNDGVGDNPLSGVLMALLDKGDNVAETETNSDGSYEFPKVPMGQYNVTEQNPANYIDLTDSDGANDNMVTVSITPQQLESTGNDFVDLLVGSITGRVTEDVDGDKIGDKVLPSVLITLLDSKHHPFLTTVTDSNGEYFFSGLSVGEYTIKETNLPDYEDITDADGVNDSSINTRLTPEKLHSIENNFMDGLIKRPSAPTPAPTTPGAAPIVTPPPVPSPGRGGEDGGGVNGDPIIMGLSGQLFKFNGRSGGWYSFASSDSFQWNAKVQKFENCPALSDTFTTGVGLTLFRDGKEAHHIAVNVVDEYEVNVGCGNGKGIHGCLGAGSLVLSIDGAKIIQPQDFSFADGSGRIIAYNTYYHCSRRWYDFDINHDPKTSLRHRTLKQPNLFEVLDDLKGTMVDKDACDMWMKKRRENNDLFEQGGHWSTIIIKTHDISMHIEYKQENERCHAHDIDVWISSVSPKVHQEHWEGVVGETKDISYKGNGQLTEISRAKALKYPHDEEYEVLSPFSVECKACVSRHLF